MSINDKEINVSSVVAKLNALLDRELGAKDEQMLLPQVMGRLIASRGTRERFTTKSNLFRWMADEYVADIVGPLGPELLKLHQFLVAQHASADTPFDFEFRDRFGAVFSDETWKSMVLQTQSFTYMVVLEPCLVFIEDSQGQSIQEKSWEVHIRACTRDTDTSDLARPRFQELEFLGKFDRVCPKSGRGPHASEYFRYKDGRDRGYLCSVFPDLDGKGYRTEHSLWGSAFSHLGHVLEDLGNHCTSDLVLNFRAKA